jgi:hypothetical protein
VIGEATIPGNSLKGLPVGEYSLIYAFPDALLNQILLHPDAKERVGELMAERYGANVEFVGGGVAHLEDARRLVMRFRINDPGDKPVIVVQQAGLPIGAIAWAVAVALVGMSLAFVSDRLLRIVVHSGELLDENGDLRKGVLNASSAARWFGIAATVAVVWWVWSSAT